MDPSARPSRTRAAAVQLMIASSQMLGALAGKVMRAINTAMAGDATRKSARASEAANATPEIARSSEEVAGEGAALRGISATSASPLAGDEAPAHNFQDQEQQADRILATLSDIAQTMTSSQNLAEILDHIAEGAAYLLAADAAAVRLIDQATQELFVEASFELSEHSTVAPRVSWGARPAGYVASSKETLIIDDVRTEDNGLKALTDREDVVSYLGVPLVFRDRVIGVIEVYTRRQARHFTSEEMGRLRTLGSQATLAIENARLFQAELDTATKLRQLEMHKSDFMAMLAHELRTPLTSIKGFAQLLLRQNGCKPDLLERYSSIIESESNRMIVIINDILDISKMEAGLLEMQKQPLSMSALVRETVSSVGYLSRGHVLEVSVPESLPLIRGDGGKVQQILLNLINNAVKYSPEGEPIEIGADADDEGITVWVNDRGRGIAADKFDHIFSTYWGFGEKKAGPQSRNSGLGLYISKNFVEAHGGKIWVESEEGKGAKFLFKLYY